MDDLVFFLLIMSVFAILVFVAKRAERL